MKTPTIIFLTLTVFSGLFLETSTAPSLITDLLTGDKGILSSLGNLVEGLLDSVAELLKQLAGVNPKVKNELTDVVLQLKNLWQRIEAGKDLNIKEIEKFISTLIEIQNKFKKCLADASEKYGNDPNMKSFIDKLAKLVDDIITNVVNKLIALLSKLLDDIANNLVPELKKHVKELKLKEDLAGKEIKLLNKLIETIDELVEVFLEPIDTGLLYKVGPLLADVQSNLATLKQVCDQGDLSDDIKNLILEVVKVVKGILAKVDGIIKAVKNLLAIVIGRIRNVATLLDDLLVDLFGEPMGEGTEELAEAVKMAKQILLELNDIISGNDIIAATKKFEVLCEIFKKIKALVIKLLDNNNLGDDFKEILEKVLKVVDKVLEEVLKVFKPILKLSIKVIKVIASKLTEDIDDILQKISEASAEAKVEELKELLTKIRELLKKIIEKIFDLIKALLAAISDVTNDSLNVVDKLLKELEAILVDIKYCLSSLREDNLLHVKDLIAIIVDTVETLLTISKSVRCSLAV